MSIRWKLNLIVGLLVGVFLLAAGFATRAVHGYMVYVRTHASVRELADLTASIHIGIYRHLLASQTTPGSPIGENSKNQDVKPPATESERSADGPSRLAGRQDWLVYTQQEVETRARLAETDEERKLWGDLRSALTSLPDATGSHADQAAFAKLPGNIEATLAALHRRYKSAEFDAVDAMASKSEQAQRAIWIAGGFIALLFLWYVILVREWLVKPIATLKSAADAIGADTFNGRIALDGTDELAQLARHMESMTERLETHRTELLKSRELSTIGELCTSVAHGLRNPLAAMRRVAQLDEETGATTGQLTMVVRDLMRQVERMSDRITKLMEFSRPRELHRDNVTFRQMALTAQAHVRELFEQRSVTLTIDDRSDGWLVKVDRDELAHALAELEANALRYCAAGSEVIVRAEPLPGSNARLGEKPDSRSSKTGRLRIRVIDDGAGMAPAEVGKAFSVFYTSRADGTGMGLAMVRRAVERHDGEVTLDSEIGKGTTVTILLPAVACETGSSRAACEFPDP